MKATVLTIEQRQRGRISPLANLGDFTYQVSEAIDPQIVIDNPHTSLYCLDDEQRRAIFVELPPEVDLAQASFFYQTQFEQAQRLIAVPYEMLPQLAHQARPTLDKLILIYSTGRCGSTLLSQIFNEVDGVTSYSEPDVFSQIIHLRRPDPERVELLRNCTRLIFKAGAVNNSRHQVLKFRNQCVEIIGLFYEAFPQAKNLFLYRNTIAWAASFYRLITRGNQADEPMPTHEAINWLERHLGRPISPATLGVTLTAEHLFLVEELALLWLILLDRVLRFQQQGIPILTLRYEELNQRRLETVSKLFDYCDLPPAAAARALTAFARDSQEGTRLGREEAQKGNRLAFDKHQIAQIEAIVAQHPHIQSPDFIMPGTLG